MCVLNSQIAICIWPFHGKEMDPHIFFIVVVFLSQTFAVPQNANTIKQREWTGKPIWCGFDLIYT